MLGKVNKKTKMVNTSQLGRKIMDNSLVCISTFQKSTHKSNASFWKEKEGHR